MKTISNIILTIVISLLSLMSFARNILWDNEISMWEDVTRKSPLKARGYNNLGVWGYYPAGRYEDALRSYYSAIRLKPDFAEAYINISSVYAVQKRMEDAVDLLRTSLDINPENALTYNNLANIYYETGRIDTAIEHYQNAIRLKPDFPEAHNNLGLAYAVKGLTDDAIREFQKAIELMPDYENAHRNLKSILSRQEQ